ncbi:MAG: T9SS type A sorting domain-containing protein [Bacteroidia bacterium]
MRKFILIALCAFSFKISAQSCGNLDFEAGSLSGWAISSGTVMGVMTASAMTGCCATASSTEAIVITTPISTGYLGTLPNSPLGGTKVAKLNDSLANGLVTRITYSLSVVPTNTLFQYAIAVVSGGISHNCGDFGYANVRIKDMSGTTVFNNHYEPMQTVSTVTNCGISSPFITNVPLNTSFFCWTTYSASLAPYIGTTITIEVTAGDCTGWGHCGYCFFDASCTGAAPVPVSCSTVTGVKEMSHPEDEISVWPNPAESMLHLRAGGLPENAELVVYDLLGNEVLKQQVADNSSISIEKLAKGAYIYRVISERQPLKTGKFIKE